ncbi:MAG: tRNA (adenosine(37)-N6)-threonylcarbamoyltransferase complex transferase subunit TsaD [Candidatus Nomurabacteria bacterium]|nr:MAG: tRNA (adenosine(37)-N6)-threonylcarbamoyltransferase complex transferase subunit TsaD [Candidatus Nomurabacteria bacterium]
MKILGIETSCDETAIAILSTQKDSDEETHFEILSNCIASQAQIHAKYGGVFPAVAKREHAKALVPILELALREAGMIQEKSGEVDKTRLEKAKEILERETGLYEDLLVFAKKYDIKGVDQLAVTRGPGLEPTLWVGINFAKALSVLWDIPLIPINHMEGHIFSVFAEDGNKNFTIREDMFPFISLLVSGGHSELVKVDGWGMYKILGETKDDAVGEAFDKVARMLGLPYPGGPEISKIADKHRKIHEKEEIGFPRPMMHEKSYDFSFSGLKTAVRYYVEKNQDDMDKSEVARAFEDAAVDVLVKKTVDAMKEFGSNMLVVGGGVAANSYLKERLIKELSDTKIFYPRSDLSGDNALMVAIASFYFGQSIPVDEIRAEGNLRIEG